MSALQKRFAFTTVVLTIGAAMVGGGLLLDDGPGDPPPPAEQHVQLRDGEQVIFLQDPDGGWHLIEVNK